MLAFGLNLMCRCSLIVNLHRLHPNPMVDWAWKTGSSQHVVISPYKGANFSSVRVFTTPPERSFGPIFGLKHVLAVFWRYLKITFLFFEKVILTLFRA